MSKQNKHKILNLTCLCIIAIVLMLAIYFAKPSPPAIAMASSDTVDINKYVDSDTFLNDSSQTIHSFANIVINRKETENNSELTQIIPKQYLSFKENDYTFGYNGEEYGFFVKHRSVGDAVLGYAKLIDVVIIDFQYTYNDTLCTVKSKIIIQETFAYKNDNGNEQWLRLTRESVKTDKNQLFSGKLRKTYYISNPSFMTMIQNENDVNYGDRGYNKKNDNGAIIYQTRLNYQGTQVIDDGITTDEALAVFDCALTILEEVVWDYLVKKVPLLGEIQTGAAMIKGFVDLIGTTISAFDVKEVQVPCNRESDIFQEQSKNTQRNDKNRPSYSCVSLVCPQDQILISNSNDGWISCTTLLNDSTSATRVHQVFEYDLFSSDYQDATKNLHNEISNEETGEQRSFAAYRRTVLFKSTSNKSVDNNGKMYYYLLEDGEQRFTFRPVYGGDYIFNSNKTGVDVKVDDKIVNSNERVFLYKNQNVTIDLHSASNNYGIGTVSVAPLTNKMVTVNSKGNYLVKYIPSETAIFTFNGKGCQTTIYDSSKNIIDKSVIASAPLIKGKTYYILYENNTAANISLALSVAKENITNLAIDKEVSVDCTANKSKYLKVVISASNQYDFVFNMNEINGLKAELISASTGNTVFNSDVGVDESFYMFRTTRIDVGIYFLKINTEKNLKTDIMYTLYVSNYKWIIDDKEFMSGDCLARGRTYTLVLKDNHNNVLSNRNLAKGIDYASVIEIKYFDTPNGIEYSIIIPEDAKMYDDGNSVNPHFEINLYNGTEKGISLCIVNNLSEIQVERVSLDDFNNIGFKIKNQFLKSSETATIYCKYRLDNDNDEWNINFEVNYKSVGYYLLYLTDKPSVNLSKKKNVTISIDYIVIKSSNGNIDRIYNKNLHPQKKNVVLINSVTSGIYFESGTGTKTDPYVIHGFTQFNNIATTAVNGVVSSCFILKSANFWGSNTANVFDVTFNGVLEGAGNSISFYDSGKLPNGDVALFRKIGTSGIIKNLEITIFYKSSLTQKTNSIGGLAIENYGTIDNCRATGYFNGSREYYGKYVGGIVARNYGVIKNCNLYTSSIIGGQYVGAIAGYSEGQILNCTVDGSVNYSEWHSDNDYIGGIVGYCAKGKVDSCTFKGTVRVVCKFWDSHTLQPHIGGIAGARTSSVIFTNNRSTGTLNVDNLNADVRWGIFKTKRFNQRGHVAEISNVV